jgi:hypothetical protein
MLRTIWNRLTDIITGSAGRAVRLDSEDRRNIPGWPSGLHLAADATHRTSAGLGEPDQHTLRDNQPIAVIPGSRHDARSART